MFGRITNFFERAKLGNAHRKDIRQLQAQKNLELKVVRDEKEFEEEKLKLEREAKLEKTKALIRKTQAISKPKEGEKPPEKKSAFAHFQDFADNFAQNQATAQVVGGKLSGLSQPVPAAQTVSRHTAKKKAKKQKSKKDRNQPTKQQPQEPVGNPLLKPSIKI